MAYLDVNGLRRVKEKIDAQVKLSDTEPLEKSNRIWVDTSDTEEIYVATTEELNEVSEELSEKADKTDTVLETTLSRGRKAESIIGDRSFAFGNDVTASESNSSAFGSNTEAIGINSFAEGSGTKAIGMNSHAAGTASKAYGSNSYAAGQACSAHGHYSHVEGFGNEAHGRSTFVFGEYNQDLNSSATGANQYGTYVEMVGNGDVAQNIRRNARTLDWSGNEALAGSLTLGKGTADEVTITAAQLKALLALLN